MHGIYADIPRTRNPGSPPSWAASRAMALQGDWLDLLAPISAIVKLRRNTEIVAQGEVSPYCYEVLSGCVRTFTLLEDGRRQIGNFLFAGDLLGYEAVGNQPFAASAVSNVTLRRFYRHEIDAYAARDTKFSHHLCQYLQGQLQVLQGRLAVMGRGTAGERIMSFLREMQIRISGKDASSFELPMKLTDIADYLGLALETVCRGMAELRRIGTITTNHSEIVIHDHRRLLMSAQAILN